MYFGKYIFKKHIQSFLSLYYVLSNFYKENKRIVLLIDQNIVARVQLSCIDLNCGMGDDLVARRAHWLKEGG